MHRAFGSWVMIRVVCLLISAVGWRRTTSVSPRPRRRIRQRVAVGEFDNNQRRPFPSVRPIQSLLSASPAIPSF